MIIPAWRALCTTFPLPAARARHTKPSLAGRVSPSPHSEDLVDKQQRQCPVPECADPSRSRATATKENGQHTAALPL
jgi:hypothetical protein